MQATTTTVYPYVSTLHYTAICTNFQPRYGLRLILCLRPLFWDASTSLVRNLCVGITAAWSAADPTDPFRILQTIYGYFRSFMDPSNPSAHSAEATASAVVSAGRQQSNRNVDK